MLLHTHWLSLPNDDEGQRPSALPPINPPPSPPPSTPNNKPLKIPSPMDMREHSGVLWRGADHLLAVSMFILIYFILLILFLSTPYNTSVCAQSFRPSMAPCAKYDMPSAEVPISPEIDLSFVCRPGEGIVARALSPFVR